jgi:hypothetical protein
LKLGYLPNDEQSQGWRTVDKHDPCSCSASARQLLVGVSPLVASSSSFSRLFNQTSSTGRLVAPRRMLPVRISWESHEARRNPARRRNAPHTALQSSNERRGPATGPSDFKRRGLTIKRHGRWVSDSAVRVAPQSRSPAQLPASGTSRCADGCCIRTVCSSPPPTVVNLPRTHLRLVARSARSIVRASDWGSHEPLMAAPHPPSHIRDGLPTRPPTRQSILWRRTRKRHSLQRFCQKTPFRVQTVVTCPKRCGTLGAGAPPHGTDARGRAHHGDAPRKRLLVAKRALPYQPLG